MFFSNSVHVACSRMFLLTSSINFCYFFDFVFFVTQFPTQNMFLCSFLPHSKTVIAYVSTIVQRAWQNIRVCLFTHGAKRHAPRVFQPQIRSGCIFIFFLQTNVIFLSFIFFTLFFQNNRKKNNLQTQCTA